MDNPEKVPLQTIPESSRESSENGTDLFDANSNRSTEKQAPETKENAEKPKEKDKERNWFVQDMLQPHLAWVKVVFFLQSAGLVSLYPYLSIHMRSMGFTVEDTAMVNTALPVADIVGGYCFGGGYRAATNERPNGCSYFS